METMIGKSRKNPTTYEVIAQYKILKEQSEVIRQQIVKMNKSINNLTRTKEDIEKTYNDMIDTIKKLEVDNPAVIFS